MIASPSTLALLGGPPVRTRPFQRIPSIGEEETRAVLDVLASGNLSQFLGTWSEAFYGGPRVRELESAWAAYFGAKHAVAMNSATSGLYAAVGALDLVPGDEVIVTPYTMSASATGIVLHGANPVFADVLDDTFCLDPSAVRRLVTPRTKAIVVVDLFGHPADMDEIRTIAAERGLRIIEDAAQAPGATYKGKPAGTLGDMGVFSLNYHKTIHAGEGGIVVTDNDDLAERLQLIRNHAEVVVKDMGARHLDHLIGFNFRMTEIEAAIAREQLRKLGRLTEARIRSADRLTRALRGTMGLGLPVARTFATHVFYVYAIRYDEARIGIPRDTFVRALVAEGIPMYGGYVEPIYLEPLYHSGRQRWSRGNATPCYDRGICPVVERLYDRELIYTDICRADLTDEDLNDVTKAIEKVLSHRDRLQHEVGAREPTRSFDTARGR